MSTLQHYLAQFTDAAQPRIHSYASHVHSTLTFKALAKQAQVFRTQHSQLGGARVAVTMTASSDVLTQLVALDGYAAELILLPVDCAVPSSCEFHINERGQLRKLQVPASSTLPVVTQWSLLGENHQLVTYTLHELAANELVQRGRREQPLRWGVMQEPAELAGLLIWIRALKHGEDIVLAQADSLKTLAQMFMHAEVTAIAAPPRLWRSFMAWGEVARLGLQLAIVNGGLVDAPTMQRLRAQFADVQVAHAFSYTQAGVSWLVTDGQVGFPGALFEAAGASGVVGGSAVVSGASSAGAPAVDAGVAGLGTVRAVLRVNQRRLDIECLDSGTRISTNYLVEQAADGRVHMLGHADNVVSVGGREVHLEQVETALLAVPEVLDVQAGSMSDPVLGALVRVDIFAPEHRTVAARKRFKETLQEHCRNVLEPWQRPARYNFHG